MAESRIAKECHVLFMVTGEPSTNKMAWRLVHEEMQRRVVWRERIFHDRTHPLEVYDDVELVERYMFRRADILWLVEEFGGELEYDCA